MKQKILIIICLLYYSALETGFAQIKNAGALKSAFNEVEQLLKNEKEKMWGVCLYGPIMFIDPATKEVAANRQNKSNTFSEKDGLFFGKLEKFAITANTVIDYDNEKWTTVLLPLPANDNQRRSLIIHELFHRVQDRLGLDTYGDMNKHMNNKEARVLLRLEWNALIKAITDKNISVNYHLENALLFRLMRRYLYSEFIINENYFELQEGLAEYAGITLGFDDDSSKIKFLSSQVETAINRMPSFIRGFAYISGPIYGFILDNSGKEWRKELNSNSDLGMLIWEKYKLKLNAPNKELVDLHKEEYGFAKIEEYESLRDDSIKVILASYRKIFLKDPSLMLQGKGARLQFNPMEVYSLDNDGTVYRYAKATDIWGVLRVEKEGFLLSPDWKYVTVSAPFTTEGNTIKGIGWVLVLNEGWKAIPKGSSFIVTNQNETVK